MEMVGVGFTKTFCTEEFPLHPLPSVTVTDGNGCKGNSSVQNVLVNPTPTISISGNNTICSGHNATLSAAGGNTYSWLPSGQTTSSLTTPILNSNTSYTVI